MGLDSIKIGNNSAREILTSFLRKGRLPSVLLFFGPSGSGKSYFAHHVIQDILCESPNGISCCQTCSSCRTVKALSSPDLLKIFSKDGSSIKMEDIKKAQEFSSLQPVYGNQKIIWIEDVHLLTTEAFNSILKILEEPNQTTMFLMTTSKLDSILPTVRSRSTAVSFSSYSEKEICEILVFDGCETELAEKLAKLCNGNIKKALDYRDPNQLELRRTQTSSFLQLLQTASFFSSYQYKDEILNFVSTSQSVMQDLLQMKLFPHLGGILNIEYEENLLHLSKRLVVNQLIEIWNLLIQAEIDLNRVNVNMKAYFELLCVSIKNIALFC